MKIPYKSKHVAGDNVRFIYKYRGGFGGVIRPFVNPLVKVCT